MISSVVNTRSGQLACLTSLAVFLTLCRTPPIQAQPGAGTTPVTVAEALKRKVRTGQTFVGTVVPIRKAVIGSAVDGRVAEFSINEGDRVKNKDKLAQLLTETITSELETARAELELRKAELYELDPSQVAAEQSSQESGTETTKAEAGSAQTVKTKKGKLDKEIAEAEALVTAAEASLKNARDDLDRAEVLYKRNTITKQERDKFGLEVLLAESVVKERKAAFEYADNTKDFRINQAEARVTMQREIVKKLEDQLAKHTIRTRFDGYVTAEYTEEGAWVNRGDPVAEVAALDEVDVLVSVLDEQSPYVYKGEKVTVEIPALPKEDRTHPGVVVVVNPQADPRTRTVPVKIRVTNKLQKKPAETESASQEEQAGPDDDAPEPSQEISTSADDTEAENTEAATPVPLIKAGMLANVTLPTGPLTDSWYVPLDAITLLSPGKPPIIYVFQSKTDSVSVGSSGVARPVVVKTGEPLGSLIAVEVVPQGDDRFEFKKGDRVVVRGNERLRPGQSVKITSELDSESMASEKHESTQETATTSDAAPGKPTKQ